MISESSIDRIREIPIYQVVSHFVPDLKKNGSGWKAKTPFGNEKTGSFFVVPAKNIFKCFSTGKGGDGIRFVMEHEKVDFVRAIEIIAQKTGERLEYERPATPEETEKQTHREKLFKITEATARKYAQQLLETDGTHPAFHELINKRQFTADTILQWQIGYAPDEWKFLTSTLIEKGLAAEGKELHLIREKDQNVYDTFRHRIIFPIHDHRGRVVSLAGRILPGADFADAPKYINGNETALYHKSHVLYGLHFASSAIAKHGYAYVMEGYTDVISFHQAGYTATVGTCGTALTPEQCRLLKRYAAKVILFAEDEAGANAAMRNIDLLMAEGFEVHVVELPAHADGSKMDPDDLVRLYK